jgi:GTPase Era involved in 16S rRNA processing
MHPLQHSGASDIEKTEDIVRCHLLDLYHDELPYEWQVQTAGWTPYLDVDIYMHTEVHKGILIGRQSKCIKQLWLQAQTSEALPQTHQKLVLRGKLMKEFISKEVRRGTDLSELRNSRLHPEGYSLAPRLQRLIAPLSHNS